MNLLKAIIAHFGKEKSLRYRDRRGYYVTDAMTCQRDLYWAMTGEKETNPSDITGKMKMFAGDAIEKHLINGILSQLHLMGVHLMGTQIPVGGSNPNYDGSLDGLLCESRDKSGPYVLEVKTKSGYGADMFFFNPDPGEAYLSQMGLYLKDLSAKGITSRGCFLFVLLSDKNFGQFVQIDCTFDPSTDVITANLATYSDGTSRKLNLKYDVNKSINRFKEMDNYIATKTVPPATYKYKYDLTPELLAELSDAKLKKAIDGGVIIGDWQPKYSRYKDKQIAIDGTAQEYTAEERALLIAEYKKRKPKSKVA